MRVAVNAEQLLYRSPGGIGRYTAQLLTVLKARFPTDEVIPFTARHQPELVRRALTGVGMADAEADRAVILTLPRPVLYDSWLTLARPKLPDLRGADIVHAPSVAVPPKPRVPLVVTVHDAAPEIYPDAFPRRGRRFHRRGLAAAAKRADVVIAVSEAAAAEIVAHSDVPSDRIRVVHNGVDPPELSPSERDALVGGRGLRGRRYVLWVGSLEPRKGVQTLLSAMAELRRRRHPAVADVQTVLAGYEGWLNRQLIVDTDRDALGSSLQQLGRVSEPELWALYSGASLFAFPSRHEGFGLPVLEAMSQGTAVVASDIPVMREITGGAARLVAPGDLMAWAGAVGDLLADEAELRRLGQAGLANSTRFGIDSTADATRAIYADLVGD